MSLVRSRSGRVLTVGLLACAVAGAVAWSSLARAAANPDVQASLARQAIDADVDGTTESFAALVRADVERWRRVVRSAQIKPD